MLALVVPLRTGIHVPVVMQFAVSVVTAARQYDHDVLLLTQEEGEEGLRRVADTALVDALIVMDVQLHDPRLPLLRALDRPSVLIGFPAEPAGLTCIDLDFRAAGEACVEQLALLGHRCVALVGSPPEVYVRETGFAQRVAEGFTAAADRHGLTSSVHPCEASAAAARTVAEQLLRRASGADRRRGPQRTGPRTARRRLRAAGPAGARRSVDHRDLPRRGRRAGPGFPSPRSPSRRPRSARGRWSC